MKPGIPFLGLPCHPTPLGYPHSQGRGFGALMHALLLFVTPEPPGLLLNVLPLIPRTESLHSDLSLLAFSHCDPRL